jgi:cobalt transporter subunit CbtA
MDRFRHMMTLVLLSGAAAGLILFAVQHLTIEPLIQKAEVYEKAGEDAAIAAGTGHHHDEGWQPADGWERTSFTALATVLTGIGFAAVLFGVVFLAGKPLNPKSGLLWGLAAFTCIGLARAFGLPPQPPGVAAADIYARQIWWVGTVVATAIALWLFFGKGIPKLVRPLGIVVLIIPHLIGAPVANGENVVPAQLIHRFAMLSIATTGMFWLLLGSMGGFLYKRIEAHDGDPFGSARTRPS